MNNNSFFIPFLVFLVCIGSASCVFAFEKKSRYTTIRYENQDQLRKFNDSLYLGRSLSRMLRKKKVATVAGEVGAKMDIIIEKAQVVLDMYPDKLRIEVVLLPKAKDVAKMYKKKYGHNASHIAYYSLSEKTIYLSVNDVNLEVFSHEIGHAVVDHYFKVRPPYNIHELMAQFTSKHIQD